MDSLSPAARRRSLKLELENIEQKIVRVQEEIYQLEQGHNPGLFGEDHPALRALKGNLKHLEGVARQIRRELQQVR